MSSNPNVLADRDTNTTMHDQSSTNANPFTKKESSDSKPKTMDFHRQMMENKLKENEGQESKASYVSPSDNIMSPASQKLSSFKQRQMNKQMGAPVKSRSLFAKTVSTREKDLGPEEPQQEVN